jgi:glyoxylase-like metal-dependent hydrolase (beta-lactamase superfamily II)
MNHFASSTTSINPDHDLDALQVAVHWPNPAPATIVTLAARFAARGRHQDARAFFHERAQNAPSHPLFGAMDAIFQLPTQEAHARLATFSTDFSISRQQGFRFTQPRLVELAPRVHVAQGFDFGDFAFVATRDRVVAIDAGTTPVHVQHALDELRAITPLPITDVIVTHAHWDHVGGLSALNGSGVRVIASAEFAEELRSISETAVPFRYFFGTEAEQSSFDLTPDLLIADAQTLVIGETEFQLFPVHGGETRDALLVHLPALGVTFTGDAFMPYLGAPFLPEGSAEGLFDTIELLERLSPSLLVHGHAPLTDQFTIQIVPVLGAALRLLYQQVLDGIRAAETLPQILGRNVLPEVLRTEPAAVMPYLIMRENFVKRVYHQRSGYWKPDGEGIEVVSPDAVAAAVSLLAGGHIEPFVESARTLLAQYDDVLALRLIDLGLRSFGTAPELLELRQRALQRLRATYRQFSPFKYIIYSEWADKPWTADQRRSSDVGNGQLVL